MLHVLASLGDICIWLTSYHVLRGTHAHLSEKLYTSGKEAGATGQAIVVVVQDWKFRVLPWIQ